MFKIPTFTFIFIIYTTSLQGSAGSDDYEIIIPSVVQNNQSWPGHGTQLGPRYHVEKPVQLEILGPRNYNVREGEELALICHDKNNRHNNMIAWKRMDDITRLWSPVGPNIGDNTRDMDGVWTENRQVGSTESLSVVVISNPMTDHLGHYVCTANNSLGYDQKTVHLKGFNEEVKEPQHVTAAMSLGNQNFSVNIVIFIKLYSLIVIVQSI